MKIGSPLPHKKARIEIIPLIDIMFFLLAAFMLASLSMMRLQSIKMDLPTTTVATKKKIDIVNMSVDKMGNISIDKTPMNYVEVSTYLSNQFRANTNIPVYINADKQATHGKVIGALDLVRAVGIEKVSFAIAPPAAKTE
jgi:biopolymer transport protein ExbD